MNEPDLESTPADTRRHGAVWWVERIGLLAAIVAVAGVVAARAGVVSLPGSGGGVAAAQARAVISPAAQGTADRRWAASVCDTLLSYKQALTHDLTSLDLSFGPGARLGNALAATTHTLSALGQAGLPPGAEGAQAKAATDQLSAEVSSRVQQLRATATSLAGGDLGAAGRLVSELESDASLGTQLAGELRHRLSADLGLSLAETRSCRKLVGIPL